MKSKQEDVEPSPLSSLIGISFRNLTYADDIRITSILVNFVWLLLNFVHGTCDLHYIEDTEEKDKSSRYAIGCNT
jgi:hypothetical protein